MQEGILKLTKHTKEKHTKAHRKRGDRARHGHNTINNPQNDHPEKKKSIYLKKTNPKIKRKQEGEKKIPENCTFT